MKTSKLSKPSKPSKPASRFVAAVIVAVLLGTGFTAPIVWAGDPPPANPNDPLDRNTTAMTDRELSDYLDDIIADGDANGYTWPPAPIPGVPGMDPGEVHALALAFEAAAEAAAARQREAEEDEARALENMQQAHENEMFLIGEWENAETDLSFDEWVAQQSGGDSDSSDWSDNFEEWGDDDWDNGGSEDTRTPEQIRQAEMAAAADAVRAENETREEWGNSGTDQSYEDWLAAQQGSSDSSSDWVNDFEEWGDDDWDDGETDGPGDDGDPTPTDPVTADAEPTILVTPGVETGPVTDEEVGGLTEQEQEWIDQEENNEDDGEGDGGDNDGDGGIGQGGNAILVNGLANIISSLPPAPGRITAMPPTSFQEPAPTATTMPGFNPLDLAVPAPTASPEGDPAGDPEPEPQAEPETETVTSCGGDVCFTRTITKDADTGAQEVADRRRHRARRMQERRARQRQADNMRQNSAARSAAGLGYADVESPLGAENPARVSDQRGMTSLISNLGRLIEQQRGN